MIIQRISKTGLPVLTENTFTATFNVPTVGKYDFNVAANERQLVMELDQRYYYLIDAVSAAATVAEGDYLLSLETTPLVRLYFRHTPYPIYPRALPIANYIDGLNWNFWFSTKKGGDALMMTLNEGVLDQIAAFVGVTEIKINIGLVIYQEENLQNVATLNTSKQKAVQCFNE